MGFMPSKIWTQQPQQAVGLTQRCIAAGLASVGFGRDLASGSVSSVGGTRKVTAKGIGVTAPLATIALARGVATGYTLIAVVDGGAGVSENFIGADFATRYWQFRSNGGASVQFIPFDSSQSPYFATAPTPPSSQFYVVIGTVGNGIAQAWSGALGGAALSDGSVFLPSPGLIPAGQSIFLGSRDGNNNVFSGTCLAYAVLEGAITAAQAGRLIENPWQIFSHLPSRIFAAVAGGGALSINAASGSFALTGVAATLAKHGLLSASAGTYGITGSASTLAAGRKLNASPGTYIITGSAATFGRAVKIQASAGAVTISGAAATLVYTPYSPTPVLNAESGSVSVTGASAALSAHHSINAASGSVALTGASAELLYNALVPVLNAGAGSVTITGAAASLIYTGASGLTLSQADIDAIAAAVLAALSATTIPVDVQKTNGVEIIGDGTEGNKFRSVYVG